MHAFPRPARALLFAAAALVFAAASGVAFSGDDDDLAEEPNRPLQDQRRNDRMVVIQNVYNIDSNINGWIFGSRLNGRQKLEWTLRIRTDEAVRAAALSAKQERKLLLAGRGDIGRFLDRVDELKLRYQATEFTQEEWNRLFQEIRPLQTDFHKGLFGADSLFAKTLTKMLNAEQAAHYDRAEGERRAFQHRARVEMTVMRLGVSMGLRDEQRKRLVQLLLEKTQPLEPFGKQDFFVVLAQMNRLPEETLKPLFDAAQWRDLQRLFERVPQIAPALLQDGIILKVAPSRKR